MILEVLAHSEGIVVVAMTVQADLIHLGEPTIRLTDLLCRKVRFVLVGIGEELVADALVRELPTLGDRLGLMTGGAAADALVGHSSITDRTPGPASDIDDAVTEERMRDLL